MRRYGRALYQRLHGRRGVLVEINGRRHRVSARVARGIPRHIDAPALPLWLDAVRDQHCVLDVGANIGIWSILAAARMRRGSRVIAVEPSPGSFEILRDCARVNDAPARIVPVHAALSDRPGTALLHLDQPTAPTNRLTRVGDGATVPVRVMTVDGLCAEEGLRPGAIKMDVEGWELLVLGGARATLDRDRPLVVLELHWGGETNLQPEQILSFARSLGYILTPAAGSPIRDVDELLRQNFVLMRPSPR